MNKVVDAKDAVKLIRDGNTVAILGNGGGILEPKSIYKAVEESFLTNNCPKGLTIIHSAGIGDKKEEGLNRFAHEEMVKRVIGGHWGWSPKMQQLAVDNKIEAYNLPQGVICLNYREIAAKRPGLITKIGLETFVDPEVNGAKLNDITKEDIVEKIKIDGEDWLRYKPYSIDVSIIRGTTADENGNISFEEEPAYLEAFALAQAAYNSKGKVICQVKYLAKGNLLNPKDIKIPGFMVSAVVVENEQMQTSEGAYDPSLSGQIKKPISAIKPMTLNHRKIIARRAALELKNNNIINLGFGMPDGVSSVAAEENIIEHLTFTVEQGIVGGVPAGGAIFGVAYNPDVILDAPSQFDFYSGHGLDLTCLGLAQVDKYGNVNVSKFGTTISGCGGFIDISQTAKKCIFCGTFTVGGLKTEIKNGELHIIEEGKNKKFLNNVEHITFSGKYAKKIKQEVLYVTERAVFTISEKGLELIEIAPGINLEKDILENMEFEPMISKDLKIMDLRIFKDEKMNLKEDICG